MANRKQQTGPSRRNLPAATIAGHVAAILAHLDTPACVYNALVDAVSDLDAPHGFFDSQEYVEVCLHGTSAGRREIARGRQ